MHTRFRVSLVALALTLSLACASDDSNDIDEREAQVGWQATGHVLALARAELDAGLAGPNDLELTIVCPGGGEARVARAMDDAYTFQFDAELDACVADDVTIDGDLSVTTSVAVDVNGARDGSIAVLMEYTGRLVFGGSSAGVCIVDAVLHGGAVRMDGRISAGVQVDGSLCGHDAGVVVSEPD